MIDLQDDLIPLSEVPGILPRRRGRRLHLSSIYRWAQHGVRGVRLEVVRVGGVAYTSRQALDDFVQSLSEPAAEGSAAAPRPSDERRADALGL